MELARLRKENESLRRRLAEPQPPPKDEPSAHSLPAPPSQPAGAATADGGADAAARRPPEVRPPPTPAAAPSPAGTSPRNLMYANALSAIYAKHNPEKLSTIPTLLEKCVGCAAGESFVVVAVVVAVLSSGPPAS